MKVNGEPASTTAGAVYREGFGHEATGRLLAIRKTIEPYLAPIAGFLTPTSEQEEGEGAVSGEGVEN